MRNCSSVRVRRHLNEHLSELETFPIPRAACVLLGHVAYYSILSSLLWMSILCYDVHRTLRRGSTR